MIFEVEEKEEKLYLKKYTLDFCKKSKLLENMKKVSFFNYLKLLLIIPLKVRLVCVVVWGACLLEALFHQRSVFSSSYTVSSSRKSR